jgi:hypothetical protein
MNNDPRNRCIQYTPGTLAAYLAGDAGIRHGGSAEDKPAKVVAAHRFDHYINIFPSTKARSQGDGNIRHSAVCAEASLGNDRVNNGGGAYCSN